VIDKWTQDLYRIRTASGRDADLAGVRDEAILLANAEMETSVEKKRALYGWSLAEKALRVAAIKGE
jgi:hypothetical protein